MSPLSLSLLFFAISVGQLIKVPVSQGSGVTLLDLVVVLLCLSGLIKSKFRLKKPPSFILAGLVFAAICFVSLFSSPLSLTGEERLTSFFYTVRFFVYILFGWLFYQKVIPQVMISSGLVLAVIGLLQLIFLPDLRFLEPQGWDPHYFRTVSTFLDPNFLGAYLVLALLTLFHNKFHIGGVLLVYLALLTTFSRGAYLAFLTSFLSLSYLKRSTKLAFLSVLLFFSLMLSFFTYQNAVAAPKGIDRVQSATARLDTWQQGFEIFEKSPILGVGFNAYRYALREYNLADERFTKSHGASSNDSSLIFVLATTGLVGLASYLFFLILIGRQGFRINKILLAGLIGLVTQSFFANTLFYPPLLLWLVVVPGFEPETSPM